MQSNVSILMILLAFGTWSTTGCRERPSSVRERTPPPVSQQQIATEQHEPVDQFGATLKQVDELPEGRYSMWWNAGGSGAFVGSRCHAALDRAYTLADGIETRVLGAQLSDMDAIEPHVNRMQYTDDPLTIFLAGPGDIPIILTVSQEKGIRFHFHETACDPNVRDAFLERYADYVALLRDEMEASGASLDADWEPRAIAWWHLGAQSIQQMEDIESFGSMIIGDGS